MIWHASTSQILVLSHSQKLIHLSPALPLLVTHPPTFLLLSTKLIYSGTCGVCAGMTVQAFLLVPRTLMLSPNMVVEHILPQHSDTIELCHKPPPCISTSINQKKLLHIQL